MALTVAYAQLAAVNGAAIRLASPVTAVRAEDDEHLVLSTPAARIRARFVVNAAGLAAGRVSRLAGGEELRFPRLVLAANRRRGRPGHDGGATRRAGQ